MILELIISEFDFWLKENIRIARIKSEIDQVELSHRLGVSEGYIGNIENLKNRAKPNTRMISRIANALNLETYSDLLPKQVLENDIVRVKLELLKINTRKQVVNDDGEVPERFKLLSIEPLSSNEISRWNALKKPYLIDSKLQKKIFI
ncbi:helix-turn-helix transcriptional regulator [Allomuricauda taeanensis]|uniref:helix-turn-helix domain-containing protein n=1 Tax=Flagellimonas taeanensis TaxID=1005926 RepID=UPI002E7BA7CA|nr:helix-turn-helix transcriptional regulator [Allomuricauda taeanensis]MEE1962054.1 helix-turn-helix transcriptional regulator [Allomuricauda taeanensis]